MDTYSQRIAPTEPPVLAGQGVEGETGAGVGSRHVSHSAPQAGRRCQCLPLALLICPQLLLPIWVCLSLPPRRTNRFGGSCALGVVWHGRRRTWRSTRHCWRSGRWRYGRRARTSWWWKRRKVGARAPDRDQIKLKIRTASVHTRATPGAQRISQSARQADSTRAEHRTGRGQERQPGQEQEPGGQASGRAGNQVGTQAGTHEHATPRLRKLRRPRSRAHFRGERGGPWRAGRRRAGRQ